MDQRRIKQPIVATVVIAAMAIGLGMGWLVTRLIDLPSAPSAVFANLGAEQREEYAILVAAGYAHDGDLAKAQAHLERLGLPNVQSWLAHLVDGRLIEEPDDVDTQALVVMAAGLGVNSRPVMAYLATLTPRPTNTPPPTSTPTATTEPTLTPIPATNEPTATLTAVPPTATLATLPTDTPPPLPSDTPGPLPSDTPIPAPTNTPRPQPSATPRPANTPAVKWSWTARLIGPGQDGQSCAEGNKMIRVTVLDGAGQQIPGVWVHEKYTGWYLPTGHKGDDPFWGPGEVELNNLDGGQVCIAGGDGGACESELTRSLPCHDPPPFEDLWAAGYCECCEPGITQERCRELFESGKCLGISHYSWRVEFRRSW